MGRQSHLARLALGRSPFEAPLRDEEGDFIVGPNTQRNNASGYIQEFDARGHPHNERSEHSRLKLRRAQNDVLSIVGVVVKRAETNQSRWDAMTSKQKDQHLSAETVAGTLCRSLAEVYRRLSTRWIVAMRRRTMCFRSNLGLPFTSTIVSEWNTVGARAFFFGGYPLAAVSEISQTFRNNILEENLVPEPTRLLRVTKFQKWLAFLRRECLQVAWFTLEYPFYACSVLQTLSILPHTLIPPLWAFLPVDVDSSWGPWPVLETSSISGIIQKAQAVLLHPFVLAYIQDRLGRLLFLRIHRMVHRLVPRPERPDGVSILHSRRFVYPEAGMTLLQRIRSRAQETSKQDIIRLCEDVLCVVFNFWERNFQVRRGLLPVEMCAQLKHTFFQRVAVYYSDMNRRNRDPRSRVRLPDQTLRILALQYTMSDHHIDTVEVDLATDLTMDDAASVSSVSGSTSTPDPHDLDIETTAQEVDDTAETVGAVLERASSTRESVEQGHMSPEVAGQDAPNTVQELDEILGEPEPPTPTWQTLVEESGARNEMEEETWARVSTPIPGISRASSLAQAMPRPVRRPTEVEEGPMPVEEENIFRPRQSRGGKGGRRVGVRYRLTRLSTHGAEFLTRSVASLVKSVLMLPMDILFFRSLTNWALASEAGLGSKLGMTARAADLWPLLDFSGLKSMHFWNAWALSLGLEALITLGVWRTTTRIALDLGIELCGWGQF